jgi:uncharacterized membrane protein
LQKHLVYVSFLIIKFSHFHFIFVFKDLYMHQVPMDALCIWISCLFNKELFEKELWFTWILKIC